MSWDLTTYEYNIQINGVIKKKMYNIGTSIPLTYNAIAAIVMRIHNNNKEIPLLLPKFNDEILYNRMPRMKAGILW